MNEPCHLAFGTYRIPPSTTEAAVRLALDNGVRRIDTAQLYKNETETLGAVRAYEASGGARVHVTSKVYDNLLFEPCIARVEATAEALGRPLDRMLLHRPLPTVMYAALDACVDRGLVREVGVSNYAIHHLEHLLEARPACRRPVVNQIELHPFVGPVQALLGFCKAHGIGVEGHTILVRGQMLDFAPLVRLADRHGLSPAAVLVHWVAQLGATPVFSSLDPAHIREMVAEVAVAGSVLDAKAMAEINAFNTLARRKLYAEAALPPVVPALADITDTDVYVETVARLLAQDRDAMAAGAPLLDVASSLTTSTNRQLLTDPIANRIALRLFPLADGKPAQSSYQRYRDLVRALRSVTHAAKAGQPKAKRTSCSISVDHPSQAPLRFVAGEPVSTAVAQPTPMPVEVAPKAELEPFFDFLAAPERLGIEGPVSRPVTFTRGTYFADERMDLCKQVVGPDHVQALCAAVENGKRGGARVRHFLLGNNVACAGPSSPGAEAFAALMADPSLDIETWYLAGNCIGPKDIAVIAAALEGNRSAKAVWLKRNPLGPEGAAALGRMLGVNPTLELLDLHNTGLFDEGVAALVDAVLASGGGLSLGQLYLCANALTAASIRALGRLFARQLPAPASIDSLYLSINRLRNEGLSALVELLETGALAGLKRLDIGGVGLEVPDLDPFVDVLLARCPALEHLGLGTYRSTRDMGERANVLHPDVTPLVRLLSEHPQLRLLDVAKCGLPESSLEALVLGRREDQSVAGIGNRAFAHDQDARRLIRHAPRVVHIDSVYRGR